MQQGNRHKNLFKDGHLYDGTQIDRILNQLTAFKMEHYTVTRKRVLLDLTCRFLPTQYIARCFNAISMGTKLHKRATS